MSFVDQCGAALIAATAAIVGGAIGASGVVVAQRIARGTDRERRRHEQAALEQAAYADLIAAVGLLIDVWFRVARLATGMRALDVLFADTRELGRDAREARVAEHTARAVVVLVGDETVKEAAARLGEVLRECSDGIVNRDTPIEERQRLIDAARHERDSFSLVAAERLKRLRSQ